MKLKLRVRTKRLKLTPVMTKAEFNSSVLKSDSTKVVVFVASWCGYCRRFFDIASSPEIEGELNAVDVDDEDESLWDEFRIPLVPTIFVFQNGKEIFRQNGRPGIGLVKGDLERALAAASAR